MTEQHTRPTRVADDGTSTMPVVRAGTRTAHAQAAKVLTTGASVSMVLGIVAYMAHSTAAAEEAAQLQELQAQQATQLAAQQAGVAPSTTLPGSMPVMVVLPDGSIVPASTLIPGAVPTSAVAGAGGASVTMPAGTGTVAGGGTATTQPATTTPSGGGVVVTTVPATNPPTTLAPTTTVVVTVAPTTTVSGGSGTSN